MNIFRSGKHKSENVQTIVTRRHEIPNALIAWTDGACDPNPGPGGWGFRLEKLCGEIVSEDFGGDPQTTNNRMELLAVIKAVGASPSDTPLIVCTDSQLTLLCATGRWAKKTNLDLWEDLAESCSGRLVVFEWWRGHCGTPGNERADWLASQGMRSEDDADSDVLRMLREIAVGE